MNGRYGFGRLAKPKLILIAVLGMAWMGFVRGREQAIVATSEIDESKQLPAIEAYSLEADSLPGQPLWWIPIDPDQQADFESPWATARREIETRPQAPEAWLGVGKQLAYSGRYREAIQHRQRVLAGEQLAEFGYIAAEAELAHRWYRTLPLETVGGWQFSIDNGQTWQSCTLPHVWEDDHPQHEGKVRYRCQAKPIDLPAGHHLLLHFSAVATEAQVSCNGVLLGQHLGGWTPFRCEMSQIAEQHPQGPWEIVVDVDERVGHLTQGFLPTISPHFGGIWQEVHWVCVPANSIDDLRVGAMGDVQDSRLRLKIPVAWDTSKPPRFLRVSAQAMLRGERDPEIVTRKYRWSDLCRPPRNGSGRVRSVLSVDLDIYSPKLWSCQEPWLYEVRVELVPHVQQGDVAGDAVLFRAAFREILASGDRLLLNGKPLTVRGILNWGLAPDQHGPVQNVATMRAELDFARTYGFNLMKFCLWIPPKRYLDLCDEQGLLAWVEYPTWQVRLDEQHWPQLRREYNEFLHHDRNHPCVILRSLTCEAGSAAELSVLKRLYQLCKLRVPGALVVDDSSWIEWNRVHDFFDDHPYGNNHTWPATLKRLKRHVQQHGPKPLVLGEAIAADTWYEPTSPTEGTGDTPLWQPLSAEASRAWRQRISTLAGEEAVARLAEDSRDYAWAMRKYQIEAFRAHIPHGGYVVSVLRDFRLASMGLLDFWGRPKWTPEHWRWHGPRMFLLKTDLDQRCFSAAEPLQIQIGRTADAAWSNEDQDVRMELRDGDSIWAATTITIPKKRRWADVTWPIPRLLADAGHAGHHNLPRRCTIEARNFGPLQGSADERVENAWNVWLVPPTRRGEEIADRTLVHRSLQDAAPELGLRSRAPFDLQRLGQTESRHLIYTRELDSDLLRALDQGHIVFVLPSGQKRSFPIADHWFLRGGPLVSGLPWKSKVPREFLLDLQAFDLAGPVVPRVDDYLDSCHPLVLVWDNHDLSECRTHGICYYMPVGPRGDLVVSTLNHRSLAGRWVLDALTEELLDPRNAERWNRTAGTRNRQRLEEELQIEELPLHTRKWHFRPDPDRVGVSQGWGRTDWDDSQWPRIRADRHWESQGFADLDGWAWYRLRVRLPKAMRGKRLYLNFSGVDDYYRLLINGNDVGSGGDIEQRRTAFDESRSFEITESVGKATSLLIAVEVYDWFGAGGIFRPVSLSTEPLAGRRRILH